MMRQLWFAIGLGAFWSGAAGGTPVDFEAFMTQVAAAHPEAAMDRESLTRSDAAAGRAGLPADPLLSVSRDGLPVGGMSADESGDGMGGLAGRAAPVPEWRVGVTQMFPWPGSAAAATRAAAARRELQRSGNALATDVRRFDAGELFLRMVRVSREIGVQKETLRVMEGIEAVTRSRFRNDTGSHMDLLKIQSDVAILRNDIATQELELRNLAALADLWRGSAVPAAASAAGYRLEWPAAPAGAPRSGGPAAGPAADLQKERLTAETAAAGAAAADSATQSLPSLSLTLMYMRDDEGMQAGGGAIGVSVPVFGASRRSSFAEERAAAVRRGDQALAWYERRKALAASQTADRVTRLEASLNSLSTVIIPPVREHLSAAIAQYGQGKATLSHLLETWRLLLDLGLREVAVHEALAVARLDVIAVSRGLVDRALSRQIPRLGEGMASSMTGGQMAGGGMTDGAGRARPGSGSKGEGGSPAPLGSEENDGGAAPAMGGGMGM